MHEDILKHYNIDTESLDKISELFTDKLPDTNLDVNSYEETCNSDETFRELFEDMLNTSYRYTADVATMEKYVRENKGDYNNERNELDNRRSKTHDTMISCVDILVRYIENKNIDLDLKWFTWPRNNRAGYGKFAILLTLNIFKEEIILHKAENIDIEAVQKDLNATELLIINYVLTLSKIHNEKRVATEDEEIKLNSTSAQLDKGPEEILSGFYQIYKKRYVKKD
jgi:hypothetical protein